MKQKMIAMLLAAAVAGTLAGCGSKELSNEYVTVTKYKGLEVAEVEAEEVTDEQVEQAIQSSLESTAEKAQITDRAAEMGDWVNIDFTGYVDGVAFDGGTAQAQDLQLGSGAYIGASGTRDLRNRSRDTRRERDLISLCSSRKIIPRRWQERSLISISCSMRFMRRMCRT